MAVSLGSKTVRIVTVYRPPSQSRHGRPFGDFLNEFTALIEYLNIAPDHLILAGDFSIHTDDPSNADAVKFNEFLLSANLRQITRPRTLAVIALTSSLLAILTDV